MVMKLRNPCNSVGPSAYHSGMVEGLEMMVVDAKGGVELLIDMMSVYWWQKAVDIVRSEPREIVEKWRGTEPGFEKYNESSIDRESEN